VPEEPEEGAAKAAKGDPESSFARALRLARASTLPRGEDRFTSGLALLVWSVRRLVRRVIDDRLQSRAAALAFQTLLAFVPVLALAFAAMNFFGEASSPREIVEWFVTRYFPQATNEVIDAVTPLIADVRFEAVGLFGIAVLVPIGVALVNQIELVLSDVFRTRRPRRMVRLLIYALLVLVAPMAALITMRHTPDLGIAAFIDVPPFALMTTVLFLAFRFLPGSRISTRAALSGAFVASIALAASKFGFGVWATRFAASLHIAWGTVAFIPMFLVWIFLSWFVVLLGAEITAVVQEALAIDWRPRVRPKLRRRPSYRRRRPLLDAIER
jgi:membrane protein